jgi:hypothetical protein
MSVSLLPNVVGVKGVQPGPADQLTISVSNTQDPSGTGREDGSMQPEAMAGAFTHPHLKHSQLEGLRSRLT